MNTVTIKVFIDTRQKLKLLAALLNESMQDVAAELVDKALAEAAALGDGNVSAGIRTALAMVAPQPPPPREVQVWRDPADGAHYVVLWQGGMCGAAGPMSLAQATAAQANPPAVWDADLTDVLELRWDRGEMERVDGGAA